MLLSEILLFTMKWFVSTALISLSFILLPLFVNAQEAHQELNDILLAEVVEIAAEREELIMGTDAYTTVQTMVVKLLEGDQAGETVTFDNDMVTLAPGDTIYVTHLITITGDEYYYLKDVKRHTELIILAALFVSLLLWFAGWQGARALFSLLLSIGAIVLVLIPAMLAGYNPIMVSLGVAGIILALVLFGTHGWNPRSLTAFGGTFGSVVVTSVVALVFVESMRLTGFGSDASVYLNFATDGQLDFGALLLGSIIIGILGVLDDVSITQASVTQELKAANHSLGALALYQRAIRVGRDHVGSLINTLALAYVGAALPLVLLFATSSESLGITLNQEVVAAEITRIIVGSIGLILAVPLTTLLAAWWFGTRGVSENSGDERTHAHTH